MKRHIQIGSVIVILAALIGLLVIWRQKNQAFQQLEEVESSRSTLQSAATEGNFTAEAQATAEHNAALDAIENSNTAAEAAIEDALATANAADELSEKWQIESTEQEQISLAYRLAAQLGDIETTQTQILLAIESMQRYPNLQAYQTLWQGFESLSDTLARI
jgi:hypothetical protein